MVLSFRWRQLCERCTASAIAKWIRFISAMVLRQTERRIAIGGEIEWGMNWNKMFICCFGFCLHSIKQYFVNGRFTFLQTAEASHQAPIQFLFATGGAGFCISRPLALKMAPVIRNEQLMTISDRIGFPDDVTIGFIIGKEKCNFVIKLTRTLN